MNDIDKLDLIDFYKRLQLKIITEETRLDIYKSEILSIDPFLEPERAMEKKVQCENQQQFIDTLHQKEKDLVNKLNGYGRTLNDVEVLVFTQGIMCNVPCKVIAERTNKTEGYIRNVKSRLYSDLKSMVVKGEI